MSTHLEGYASSTVPQSPVHVPFEDPAALPLILPVSPTTDRTNQRTFCDCVWPGSVHSPNPPPASLSLEALVIINNWM